MTTPAPISEERLAQLRKQCRYRSADASRDELEAVAEDYADIADALSELLALRRAKPAEGGHGDEIAALHHDLAAVREEVRVTREANEWRPIETAPSGQFVLLYLHRPSRSQVSWDIGANDGHGWLDQSAHELEQYDWRALWWRPLPPPPAIEPAEQQSGGRE